MRPGRGFRRFCVLLCAGLLVLGGWRAAGSPGLDALQQETERLQESIRQVRETSAAVTPTATPAPAVSAGLDVQALDAFCAAQRGSFSVYILDLSTGEEYSYGASAQYYPASLLKAPYALWLCNLAEEGVLDLDGELYNLYAGQLADTTLAAYDGEETIPIWSALHAMIADSDNLAMRMLAAVWPGIQDTGFQSFLGELGFEWSGSCSISMEEGIAGVMNVTDAGRAMAALYDYFETGTDTALRLRQCFLDAGHTALFIPDGVEAAKKYGSWDDAFHDLAIVYAARPYILCCMTDQGDTDVDFPTEPVEAMQQLGRLVYEQLNPAA